MCCISLGTKRPTASQLIQTAAKFSHGTWKNFDKNKGVINDMLDKAEQEVEKEEKKQKMEEERRSRNLFVKNLAFDVDSDRLRAAFRPFGFIHSAKVMTSGTGQSRGFGFVCFGTRAEAETAQEKMHDQWVFGRKLYVSFAQSREERAAELDRKYGSQKIEKNEIKRTEHLETEFSKIQKEDSVPVSKTGQKPASWGQSLMEKEEKMRTGKNEKKDSWNMEEFAPVEEMIREDPSLMELIVPSHLTGTSKKDRRKNIPSQKKRGLREADSMSAWEPKPKKMRKIVDWTDNQSLKKSLKNITIQELCDLQEDMTFGMEFLMMDLGMGWAYLLEGARNIYEEEKGKTVGRWAQALGEEEWENVDEMNIDVEGIEDPLEGILGEEESSWETLPKNVLEKIEIHLSPKDRITFRTLSKGVMGNWWVWPRDRLGYLKWVIEIRRKDIDHVEGVFGEVVERDRIYREEKQRKREEEEEAQEARIPAALEEYLRDNGRVPGAGYRSIARKHRIDQQQLRDAVTQHDEEMEELLEDSDGDDPYP